MIQHPTGWVGEFGGESKAVGGVGSCASGLVRVRHVRRPPAVPRRRLGQPTPRTEPDGRGDGHGVDGQSPWRPRWRRRCRPVVQAVAQLRLRRHPREPLPPGHAHRPKPPVAAVTAASAASPALASSCDGQAAPVAAPVAAAMATRSPPRWPRPPATPCLRRWLRASTTGHRRHPAPVGVTTRVGVHRPDRRLRGRGGDHLGGLHRPVQSGRPSAPGGVTATGRVA